MNKSLVPMTISLLVVLAAVTAAQFPIDQRLPNELGPPEAYSFQSSGPNYSPYQFNWYTGRWDYVPIPYRSTSQGPNSSPYRFNQYTGRWDYMPDAAAPPGPGAAPAPPAPAAAPPPMPAPVVTTPRRQEDDSALWQRPATQPASAAKTEKVQGRIVGIRAAGLKGEPFPHLLLRLKQGDGKFVTVDVGERLALPGDRPLSGADDQMTAIGVVGAVDGSPVLFADHVTLGGETVAVERGGER